MPAADPATAAPPLRLVRRPLPATGRPVLDDTQQQVVEHRRGAGPLVVLGAPGTGKTTVLVETVATRVERDGMDPSAVLVLAPTRRAAGQLRERMTQRLARTVTEPLVRTPQAYAYALARRAAAADGDPPPRLISGPEQDRVLAELLAGHRAGVGPAPQWPPSVLPALGLRGFRDELRDLLMRALERGLGPQDLHWLGARHGRPEWTSAARVLQEYLDVTSLASPGAHDPAAVVDHAVGLLESSPERLRAERRRWQLVAVDDHHESGEAVGRLLDLLAGGGSDLLLLGDPDLTTQGFRGGDPSLLAGSPYRYRRSDGESAPVVVLGTRWRSSAAVVEATTRVAASIGATGGVEHRRARALPSSPTGRVHGAVLASAAAQAAYVAHVLRQAYLVDGVEWARMAVVVRSARQTSGLRRALAQAGVPVRVPAGEVPVRDEPAVRPLRLALRAVLQPATLDAETAAELVTSPLGGGDAVGLRRLRRALRAEELAGGGKRASDALLVEALAEPGRLVSLEERTARPARRVATVLAAGRAAAGAPGADAEQVLWALWSAGELPARWQRQALAGGVDAERADRSLDAVLALFAAAARFTDRMPGAGPAAFLEYLESQEIAADTLAEQAPQEQAVALVTAAGAAGREWDVVVVAGLQEGEWPDTRLRGSLLGAQALVDTLTGRAGDADLAGARAQVVADERRLLHVAVSRARRDLVVTAVRDADHRPSSFLDLVAPWVPASPHLPADPGLAPAGGERPLTALPRPVTLPALVAELRQVLECSDESDPTGAGRRQAAAHLARLAVAGVPGADPDDWYGLAPISDDGPLRAPQEPVRVSPSKVESFERCPLRWLLETSGATKGESTSVSVGQLVHAVAAQAPDGSLEELAGMLEQRWSSLGLPPTWVGAREREKADAMVRRLAEYLAAHARELVAVEAAFTARLGRAELVGRVDRLERRDDGTLVVVDLKTGSTKPAKADVPRHPQLGAYQTAVEAGAFGEHGTTSGGAALVQLGGTLASRAEQVQPPLAADEDPDWAREAVLRAADGMAGAAFDAVASSGCRTCPVRSCCPVQPEGRGVGQA